MLCFELRRNEKRLALAGVRESGVLYLLLSWRGSGSGASVRAAATKDTVPEFHLLLTGLDASDPAGDRRVTWVETEDLGLSDRIEVEVVSAEAADPPMRSEPPKPPRSRVGNVVREECSFCGQMRQLSPKPALGSGIAAANAFICLRCLVLAERLLDGGTTQLFHLTKATDRTCSFCSTEHAKESISARADNMCRDCVEMIMSDPAT